MAILHKVTNFRLTCNSIIVSKCQLKPKEIPFCCIVTEHRSSVDFGAHANDGCPHPQASSAQYSGKTDRVGGANTGEDIN